MTTPKKPLTRFEMALRCFELKAESLKRPLSIKEKIEVDRLNMRIAQQDNETFKEIRPMVEKTGIKLIDSCP